MTKFTVLSQFKGQAGLFILPFLPFVFDDVHVFKYACMFLTYLREMKPLIERSRLDRRRVEVAHLHFAILQVASWYPEHVDLFTLPLHANLDDTLTKLVAKYHGVFMSCYASESVGDTCISWT